MRLPTTQALERLGRGEAKCHLHAVIAAQEREVERCAERPAERRLASARLRRAQGRQRALGLD